MSQNNQSKILGILGGGQLGRMSAMAAANLGIKCVIFTPEAGSPASHVAWKTIIAQYDDAEALEEFARLCDVITYEFENIPVTTIEALKPLTPVYPDSNLLDIAQDRIQEKAYMNQIGLKTTRWAEVTSEQDILKTLDNWSADEAIIKTARMGYDGKGQVKYSKTKRNAADINFNGLQIMEEIVDFTAEISMLIARDHNNKTVTYGPILNHHKHGILDRSIAPANLDIGIKNNAVSIAHTLADSISLRGLLTIELFITKDDELLINEVAPRPHNSGHYTIDACLHSQFENHVRAVCAMPVLAPVQQCSAEMINLIGEDINRINDFIDNKNACIHLYGKQEIKPGRKMGHITILKHID